MGPFAVVATSVVPRARETAVAMGFAVDHELVMGPATDPELYTEIETARWWTSERPFAALAALVGNGGANHRYAHTLVAAWRDLMTPLQGDQAALVVGHSGDLETGLVACLPDADHASWGAPFGCCEGARLTFDGDPARFCAVEFLRLP
jgi:broad specificity phosphatase PhoE